MATASTVLNLFTLALRFRREPLKYLQDTKVITTLPNFSVFLKLLNRPLTDESWHDLASLTDESPDYLLECGLFLLSIVLFATPTNHYTILGLDDSATIEQVKQRYHLLIAIFHPDKNQYSNEWGDLYASQLNNAYNHLKLQEAKHSHNTNSPLDHPAPTTRATVINSVGEDKHRNPFLHTKNRSHLFKKSVNKLLFWRLVRSKINNTSLIASLIWFIVGLPVGAYLWFNYSASRLACETVSQYNANAIAMDNKATSDGMVSKEATALAIEGDRYPNQHSHDETSPNCERGKESLLLDSDPLLSLLDAANPTFRPQTNAATKDAKTPATDSQEQQYYSVAARATVANPSYSTTDPLSGATTPSKWDPGSTAESKTSIVISAHDVDTLLKNISTYYIQGNTRAFAALFADDVITSDEQGKAELYSAYRKLFKTTKARNFVVSGLSWRNVGDTAVLSFHLSITITSVAKKSNPQHLDGIAVINAKWNAGGLIIKLFNYTLEYKQ